MLQKHLDNEELLLEERQLQQKLRREKMSSLPLPIHSSNVSSFQSTPVMSVVSSSAFDEIFLLRRLDASFLTSANIATLVLPEGIPCGQNLKDETVR